jgi:hypothetical protein
MSRVLMDTLNAKLQQVDAYEAKWLDLQERMLELLSNDEGDDTYSIALAYNNIQKAIQAFKHEVQNPRITLATTGTTSGGKSSLVNLLCGAEIMPVAVREMSAGTVIIDHDPTARLLRIPPVEGLPPELSGEWPDLPDVAIQHQLTKLMDAYRQLREEHREPPAPRVILQYPTRIGMRPELVGLSKGFQVRIIDLPGFKYVADEHNRQVIRSEIRPALCLMTYNSEECDPVKQQVLLDEIVDQVRELRGSPARMLFILNRIDVFRRDRDWRERMHEFCDKTMQKVRRSIAAALPEYGNQAAQLHGQPLSTGPALYAYQALTSPHERAILALERVDRFFRFLMPEEAQDLPGRISKWSAHDCKMIAEAVWRASYAADFDQTLRQHVQDNLPQLLLPHLLKSVADVAGDCLTSVDQIAHAHIHAKKERYDNECARLASINDDLQALRNASRQELLEMITLSDDDDVIGELADRANDLQRHYGLTKDSLVPLYDWSAQLGNTTQTFLASIHEAISANKARPEGYLIDLLPLTQQNDLLVSLKQLRESGYGTYASNGGYLEAKTKDQKDRLKTINLALNELASVLALTMKGVLDRTAEQEAERIQNALQILIVGYANSLMNKAQAIAPDLTGLTITPSSVIRVKQRLVLSFVLSAGFPVLPKQTREVKGYHQVKVGEKRIWYTLWIKKRDVYETQPIYEMRTYEQAVIPSITDVFSGFIGQAKASRPEGAFTRWLRTQIEHFLNDIEGYHENLLKEYRYRLDQVRNLAKDMTDKDIATWEGTSKDVAGLREELMKLMEVY